MIRVIGVIGRKDTGKTGLIADILKNMNGMSVATVKNSHMDIDVDSPNTDSYKLKQFADASVFVTNKGSAFYYDRMHVITSYSIHYTKLYDLSNLQLLKLKILLNSLFQLLKP